MGFVALADGIFQQCRNAVLLGPRIVRDSGKALGLLGVLGNGLLLELGALLGRSQRVVRLRKMLLCLLKPLPRTSEVRVGALCSRSRVSHNGRRVPALQTTLLKQARKQLPCLLLPPSPTVVHICAPVLKRCANTSGLKLALERPLGLAALLAGARPAHKSQL